MVVNLLRPDVVNLTGLCRDVLHPPIENVKADGYGGIDLIKSKNSTNYLDFFCELRVIGVLFGCCEWD